MLKIEYYEDRAGEWRWRLKAKNGRIIADGSEGYATRGSVIRAVKNFQGMLGVATVAVEVEREVA